MEPARQDLRSLAGVRHPLIQSPMATASTPALAIAVSNAGGLGSLAGGLLGPEALRSGIRAIRAGTRQPFNVNLFVLRSAPTEHRKLARAAELIAEIERETGADRFELPPLPAPPSFEEQLEIVIEERVPVCSFTFGIPAADQLDAVHESGAIILGMATNVDEACQLEQAGFSAVIAQGAEAGGHRAAHSDQGPLIGLTELLRQCLEAVAVPIVASGGIMNGKDIAQIMGRGAAGVQLGTAFLCCPETELLPAWRAAILGGGETVVTRNLTGKPARAIRNVLIDRLEPFEPELPAFPHLAALTARLRAWAAAHGRKDYLPLLAGVGIEGARTLPAGELIAALIREMNEESG
jgi:nitronate monooxygenase